MALAFARAPLLGQVFIDLGTLGGPGAAANGVNNHGMVVGDSNTGTDPETVHAFIYDSGVMTDLGTLPGETTWPFASWGYGINDAGTAVGFSNYTDLSEVLTHAFSYSGGAMTDLGTLGGAGSAAMAVNNAGAVVGSSGTATEETHAFMWSDVGGMVDLGTLPTGNWSSAEDVNDFGVAVGGATTVFVPPPTDKIHACVWPGNGSIIDLGTLGGTQSTAWAVNNDGVVVGDSHIAGDVNYHAFRWSGLGVMEDLGALEEGASSFAYDINSDGVIVGENFLPSYQRNHAALYADGSWVDLQATYFPEDYWDTSSAKGINDRGWIVGVATDSTTGYGHAWLLIPLPLGDVNCDGALNGFDIDPFVLALTDPEGYAAAYPDCEIMLADCNQDGVVNGFDIDPFVELLTGG